MTRPLDHMHERLQRCRQAAVNAARQAAQAKDARVRQSYALLADGWEGLAHDLERKLNGHGGDLP
jgi:hypothetical protein